MKRAIVIFILFVSYQVPFFAQIANPVTETIIPSGILVELEEAITVQPSSSVDPKARINMLREVPDETGRKAIIDLRGILWITGNEILAPFLKIKDYSSTFIDAPGKGTGFGAFAFHPEYAENGLLYTTHAELANTEEADFTPEVFATLELQWVLTEWKNENPSGSMFSGSKRELIRADFPTSLHGFQDLQFNPVSIMGDKDYGLLYLCIGDGGSSRDFLSENIGDKSSYLGTIFRIDPLGNNSANGQYGIHESNPFFDDEEATKEVFAYGFRNPHRISWDYEGEHVMLIGDIGEKNIEEVNIGMAGHNYGWDKREGTFMYDRSLGREFVYPLPDNDSIFNYTYPSAQYDHDDGVAIVGGYVYRGSSVPELYGHYVFGDIPSGRLFHVPVNELSIDGPLAAIRELRLKNNEGDATTLNQLSESTRADLRFGIDAAGEIYFLTKADGKVRKFKSPTSSQDNRPFSDGIVNVFPNPSSESLNIKISKHFIGQMYTLVNVDGKTLREGVFMSLYTRLNVSELASGTYFLSCGKNTRQLTEILIH